LRYKGFFLFYDGDAQRKKVMFNQNPAWKEALAKMQQSVQLDWRYPPKKNLSPTSLEDLWQEDDANKAL
jgi:hypothetical protein